MTEAQASIIRSAIANRLNIVIAGGTGSDKTTLTNAVIAEIVSTTPDDRMVILEDTSEIQCGCGKCRLASHKRRGRYGQAAQKHDAPASRSHHRR